MDDRTWTLGHWKAKPGLEDDFREAWEAFARWSLANQPGAGEATLLQDSKDPGLFVSFGPWADEAAVAAWRASPQFRQFVATALTLCERFTPSTLQRVAHVG